VSATSHIAGQTEALTARQRELIGLAARLGHENFGPRAARHDRDATFPFENYEDLRRAGLLGLCVSEADGGLGADFATCAMVSAELGRHCGATALTFNMHVSACLWSGLVADALDMTAEQRADHVRNRALHHGQIARGGKKYAVAFSEGGAAAAGKAPWGTLARKVDGGYVVSGRKIFVSLAGAADVYGVLCTLDRPGASQRDALFLAVPADAPGLSVAGDWDTLGMRGTVSRDLVLRNVEVPETARLLPEGAYWQAAARFPHMFSTLSPTYMGIAQAAYDFTVQYLRGEVPGMPPVRRRMYPTKQIAVAEMRVRLEQTRPLIQAQPSHAHKQPDQDAPNPQLAAPCTVNEIANEICRLALRTCGGQSMLKSLPLERLYRDSRCGSLMLPWTAELCIDRLGRECLYEAGEKDETIEP
jgi:alkylation response protein AidB-like acyl-CoA dehydrogenase